MTRDEFREQVREAIDDIADPDGEYSHVLAEMRSDAAKVREYDAALSAKIEAIAVAVEELGAYLKDRGEV